MNFSSFISSILPVVHGDAQEGQPQNEVQELQQDVEVVAEEETKEEEEEPEDVHPEIREECQNIQNCAPLTKHFRHCQEKVEAGKGYPHEDCVEELPYDALCRQLRGTKVVLEVTVDYKSVVDPPFVVAFGTRVQMTTTRSLE